MRRDFTPRRSAVSAATEGGRWQRFIPGGFMAAIVGDAFLESLKQFAEARVQRGCLKAGGI